MTNDISIEQQLKILREMKQKTNEIKVEPMYSQILSCDVLETSNTFEIYMELPGIPKDKLKVEIDKQNRVIIKFDLESKEKSGTYHLKERKYRYTSRIISLPPVELLQNGTKVSFQDGLLSIMIPKKEIETFKLQIE